MLKLIAEKREIFGKKLRTIKRQDKIPAVLYGRKIKNKFIFVPLKDFKKIWKEAGKSTIIEIIEKDNVKPLNVLINDVALNPIKDEPIHIDFYAVEMDKPIKAKVPLVFIGIAPVVKESGGILVKVIHDLEIEALPKDLPHEINIDISKLKTFEDRIFVKDILLPKSVKIIAKEDEVIALAELPKEELIEEVKMSIEDIEVAKKGKESKEKEGEETEAGSTGGEGSK